MGIHQAVADMVRGLPLPKRFTVCELGDQWVAGDIPEPYLAEQLYRQLGCSRYVSIDGNGRGTLVHDLNLPLAKGFGAFDLVTDFGTGEHIFNQAQVWRTVHDLTKVGGHIAFDRPTQGYPEHCFYNTHECLFRDLAAANGYELLRLDRRKPTRGEMIYGVFKRTAPGKFRYPQQGRYKKALKL